MSPAPRYHGYRFPPDIISHAVWLYHRFALSFRDIEDLLAERGISPAAGLSHPLLKFSGGSGDDYATIPDDSSSPS